MKIRVTARALQHCSTCGNPINDKEQVGRDDRDGVPLCACTDNPVNWKKNKTQNDMRTLEG